MRDGHFYGQETGYVRLGGGLAMRPLVLEALPTVAVLLRCVAVEG